MDLLRYFLEKVLLRWQFIALLALVILTPKLNRVLDNIEKINVGDFQISIRELAKSSGISDEQIAVLNGLTYDELKIFLIKGGEDANYYNFEDNSKDREKFIKCFKSLDSKGLIEITKIDSSKIDNSKEYIANIWTNSTEKGEKIHRAILDAIYQNFVNARVKVGKDIN